MVLILVHGLRCVFLLLFFFFLAGLILSLVLSLVLAGRLLLGSFTLFLFKYTKRDQIESVPKNIANEFLVGVGLHESFIGRFD